MLRREGWLNPPGALLESCHRMASRHGWRYVRTAGLPILTAFATLCTGAVARADYLTRTTGFGGWLTDRYGASARGFWTCPDGQVSNGVGFCEGELLVGATRHLVTAETPDEGASFSSLNDRVWVRRWSRYSPEPISALAPGVASTNTPYFDWAWAAAAAYGEVLRHGRLFVVNDIDGNSSGLGRIDDFNCRVDGALVSCVNALGDGMRYEPGRACGSVAFAPQSDNVAVSIRGINVSCATARAVVRGSRPERLRLGAQPVYRANGFTCRGRQGPSTGKSSENYDCRRGREIVLFVRG